MIYLWCYLGGAVVIWGLMIIAARHNWASLEFDGIDFLGVIIMWPLAVPVFCVALIGLGFGKLTKWLATPKKKSQGVLIVPPSVPASSKEILIRVLTEKAGFSKDDAEAIAKESGISNG